MGITVNVHAEYYSGTKKEEAMEVTKHSLTVSNTRDNSKVVQIHLVNFLSPLKSAGMGVLV